MRNCILFMLLFLNLSCKEYKALMSEETRFNSEKTLYFTDSTHTTIKTIINGIPHDLLFDTGAGGTLINNPKFNLSENRKIREKKPYGFENKTVSTNTFYTTDSLNFGFINSLNKSLYISKKENQLQCFQNNKDGILEKFFNYIDKEKEIEINYSEGFIKIHETEFDKTGYYPFEMKTSSSSRKIYVKLEFDGISDYFLFDTGNFMGLILNNEIFKNLENKKISFTTISNTINGYITNNFSIFDSKLKLSDTKYIDQYVALDQNSKRSTLSFKFIKKINWIIDRKNNLIYCKPINKNALNSKYIVPKNSNSVGIINNKLLVNFSLNNQTQYVSGDEIISINGTVVTSENICKMMELLNKKPDWNTLKIEIKK